MQEPAEKYFTIGYSNTTLALDNSSLLVGAFCLENMLKDMNLNPHQTQT